MAAISGTLDLGLLTSGGTQNFNVVAQPTGRGTAWWASTSRPRSSTRGSQRHAGQLGTAVLRLSGANTFDGQVNDRRGRPHPRQRGRPGHPLGPPHQHRCRRRPLAIDGGAGLTVSNTNCAVQHPGHGATDTALYPVAGAMVNYTGNNTLAGAVALAGDTQIAANAGTKLTLQRRDHRQPEPHHRRGRQRRDRRPVGHRPDRRHHPERLRPAHPGQHGQQLRRGLNVNAGTVQIGAAGGLPSGAIVTDRPTATARPRWTSTTPAARSIRPSPSAASARRPPRASSPAKAARSPWAPAAASATTPPATPWGPSSAATWR